QNINFSTFFGPLPYTLPTDGRSPLPRRTCPTDGVELRLLLVAQRAVEIIERSTHGLHGRQYGLQALFDRRNPCQRGGRHFAWAARLQDVFRFGGRILQRRQVDLLRRRRPNASLDHRGWPVRDRAVAAVRGRRTRPVRCGRGRGLTLL